MLFEVRTGARTIDGGRRSSPGLENPTLSDGTGRTAHPDSGEAMESMGMVGMERFELSTPCSRSRCATRLRYIPTFWITWDPVVAVDREALALLPGLACDCLSLAEVPRARRRI